MSICMTGQPVRTARGEETIWQKVQEDRFRRDLVVLEERTNAVPVDPQVFPIPPDGPAEHDRDGRIWLPPALEQKVANHLAFLAAVREGAQSVAAVCLEQHTKPREMLKVRVAAADAIDDQVRHSMSQITRILMCFSNNNLDGLGNDPAAEQLFDVIIRQHQSRILGRLRSSKWEKPRHLTASHKKPLWQDFENAIHRAKHVYPQSKDKLKRKAIEDYLRALASCYQEFDERTVVDDADLRQQLKILVQLTEAFCKYSEIREFAQKLEEVRATCQVAAALKWFRQLEKIGAYWKIAKDLIATAEKHPHVFGYIELAYLRPYTSVPTSIGYQAWARTCHVHAEIQLLVDYDLRRQQESHCLPTPDIILPRVIGTSKYLCYLCYLFIKCHGRFIVPNTHGRLYDQWTVPDLGEYDVETRARYADVLGAVHEIVCQQAEKEPCWRAEPMTSRQHLLLEEESL